MSASETSTYSVNMSLSVPVPKSRLEEASDSAGGVVSFVSDICTPEAGADLLPSASANAAPAKSAVRPPSCSAARRDLCSSVMTIETPRSPPKSSAVALERLTPAMVILDGSVADLLRSSLALNEKTPVLLRSSDTLEGTSPGACPSCTVTVAAARVCRWYELDHGPPDATLSEPVASGAAPPPPKSMRCSLPPYPCRSRAVIPTEPPGLITTSEYRPASVMTVSVPVRMQPP